MPSSALRAALLAALLAAAVLAGCTEPTAPAAPPPPPAAPSPVTASLASFLHSLSEPDPAATFEAARMEHYRVPGSGGVALDTWVAVPPGEGPFPVVMVFTPYYPGGAPASLGRLGDVLLARGYAVGLSNVRGTGQSGGCFLQGAVQEAQDNAAVVEFLAAQEWSSGSVGIIGVSYDGTTPQETWVEAPPHLKAIVPIAPISDFYKYNFVNGVPILIQGYGFNTYYWAQEDLLWDSGVPGDPTDYAATAEAVQGAACPEQADVQSGGASSTVNGDKNAYWQSRDFVARLKASPANVTRAPVFYIHGLQDWNVKDHMMVDWLDAVRATGVPMKLMLGQWPHAWPASTSTSSPCKATAGVSACRADWWEQAMVAWFDQFLKGVDTGILDAPAVQVQDDDGLWRNEATWPPVPDEVRTFRLDGDVLGATEGTGAAEYNGDVAGAASGVLVAPVPAAAAEARFTSEPFPADAHVSGVVRFHANVTATGPRASLILTLAELTKAGELRPFGFAAQSLNHVASLEQGDPDIAGLRQEVEVGFFPQDDVVHAGSRLVLLAAANVVTNGEPGPSLQPATAAGTIAIERAGAWLALPIDATIAAEEPQPYA